MNFKFEETQQSRGIKNTVFSRDPLASLVREASQNCIDAAAHKNNPVTKLTYQFFTHPTDSIPGMLSLKDHLGRIQDMHDQDDSLSTETKEFLTTSTALLTEPNLSILKVSDFGTTGAEGTFLDRNKGFAYLSGRLIGGDTKTPASGKGGSKGMGKLAFIENSRVRTYIFVSYTKNGVRMCGYHDSASGLVNNNYTSPYAFLLDVNNRETESIPVWMRRKSNEIGVDIFILAPIEHKPEDIIKTSCRNLYLSILQEKVSIDVAGITLDKTTVEHHAPAAKSQKQYPCGAPATFIDAYNTKKSIKVLPKIGRVVWYSHLNPDQSDKNNYIHLWRETGHTVIEGKNDFDAIRTGRHYLGIIQDETGELRDLEEETHTKWIRQGTSNKQIIHSLRAHIQEMIAENASATTDEIDMMLGDPLFASPSGTNRVFRAGHKTKYPDGPPRKTSKKPKKKRTSDGTITLQLLNKSQGQNAQLIIKDTSQVQDIDYQTRIEIFTEDSTPNLAVPFSVGTKGNAVTHKLSKLNSLPQTFIVANNLPFTYQIKLTPA